MAFCPIKQFMLCIAHDVRCATHIAARPQLPPWCAARAPPLGHVHARHTRCLVAQPYHRFVEIGRVAMINYGPDAGRLCTILDVVDQGRVRADRRILPAHCVYVCCLCGGVIAAGAAAAAATAQAGGGGAGCAQHLASSHVFSACTPLVRQVRVERLALIARCVCHCFFVAPSAPFVSAAVTPRLPCVGWVLAGAQLLTCCHAHAATRAPQALVDGPYGVTGVNRQVINFRRLSLTDFTVSVPRHARQKTLKKALEKESVMSKWEQTAWAKRAAKQQKRSQLTDFDRFKVMIARKQVRSVLSRCRARPPAHMHAACVRACGISRVLAHCASRSRPLCATTSSACPSRCARQ